MDAWIPGFTLFLLGLATGCRTSRIEQASRAPGLSVAPATRILVAFAGRPAPFRIAFEDAFVAQLRPHGVEAEGSYGRLDLESFEGGSTDFAREWGVRTGQSLLVLRPLVGETRYESKDRRGRYDTGSASLPTPVIKPKERTVRDTMTAHEFAAASSSPSVVPGYAMVEERWVAEISFVDATTGGIAWRARALVRVREGRDESRWMTDLARVVLRRLRQEKLVP